MPTPANPSPHSHANWAVHSAPVASTGSPRDATRAFAPLPSYTELNPELKQRAGVAQGYFDQMGTYSEDTHPDSVRQLEQLRPKALPPTYWQATGNPSPLPEHVETEEAPPSYREAINSAHQDDNAVRFSPYLTATERAQAHKHVDRLNDLLEQAEQLGTLLMEREQPDGGAQEGESSIDAETVAALCRKIDRLRSSWANGAFTGSSRMGGPLAIALDCYPAARTLKENALKAEINSLWDTAKTQYRTHYLTDPLNADPILAKVYLMVKGLKRAPI